LIFFSTEGFLIYNLAFLNLENHYLCYNELGVAHACKALETCKPKYNHQLFLD
jgi:hypothetical protein